MFRMLEIMTRYAPELFLDKSQIHSTRLTNYIMFVLHSVFVGKIDSYIDYFANKVMQRAESLPQFLAPLIGILTNIYEAIGRLQSESATYDDLAGILQKTDSFDPVLFRRLLEVVKSELPPVNREEAQVLEVFGGQMLDEIEMLSRVEVKRR